MNFETPRRRRPVPKLAPLIDVVFLLLIFFLLTSTFTPPDLFPVQPPVSEAAAGVPGSEVIVLVGRDGTLAVNNDLVSPDELAPLLSAAGVVTVKADAGTPSGTIIGVLAVAQAIGATDVRLVTVDGMDGR